MIGGSATTSPLQVHRKVEQIMGMPISLALRGRHSHDDLAEATWAKAVDLLRAVDRVFSTYREDSWISRLGKAEISVDDCPPEVAEVLALGERARRASHGAFDVWRTGLDGVPTLDPSGVVKGWAISRAAELFETLVETDVCLSAGGDMVCRSSAAGSPGWRVGIEDPSDPASLIAVVQVTNGAVATSGATHRGSHVIHGRTGAVPTTVASVTVLAADLTRADLDATAAYAMDHDAARWLRTRPGRRGLVVWADGGTDIVDTLPSGCSTGPASLASGCWPFD